MNSDKNNTPAPSATAAMNELRLGAARKRLAESRGQEDAIEGLREIVANFLGSEELGLFRVDHKTDRKPTAFQVFWSFGIDLEEYDLLRGLGEAGLQRVMRGECHVELTSGERSGATAKAQAFIPIRVANETIAILAILRLLPQKIAFDGCDLELFKLLSNEAAGPLFGANFDAKPVTEGPGMGV